MRPAPDSIRAPDAPPGRPGVGEGKAAPLSPRARGWRLAATAVALALVLSGSVRGSDDSFPFGPMKMFAYSNKPNGVVTTARLRAVAEDGREFSIPTEKVGLRRAEIEGQEDRLEADPRFLGALALTYERRGGSGLVELRLEHWVYRVVDRRVQRRGTIQVLARWRRQ